MFKFVVLSCIVSVAFAGIIHAPAHYAPAHVAVSKQIVENHQSIIETPTVSHVGTKLSSVPSGVSHHSSSVVHSHAHIAEPIYAHGVQKTIVQTPIVKKVR
jgi:Drosophila Retinin like protein